MTFVFVSHASEDKPRVRSVAHALALLGTPLWIDRPGRGDSHLNFSPETIERFRIEGLRNGLPWDEQLKSALQAAGVILGCLSRSTRREREIIDNELVFAAVSGKLVACIIDDLPFGAIDDFGLARMQSVQAQRVDCKRLEKAIELYERGVADKFWSEPLRAEWQIVRTIKADLDAVLAERGVWRPGPEALRAAAQRIEAIPVGPPVATEDLSFELVDLLAETFDSTEKATRHITTAMELLWSLDNGPFTRDQLLLRLASVPKLEQVGAEAFWTDVLLLANQKSRRTLAALVFTPAGSFDASSAGFGTPEIRRFVENDLTAGGWPPE